MRFVLSALFLTLTGLCARRLSCCRAAHEFGGWQAHHARAHMYFGVWSLEFGVWNLEFGVALFPGFRVGTTRDRQHDSLLFTFRLGSRGPDTVELLCIESWRPMQHMIVSLFTTSLRSDCGYRHLLWWNSYLWGHLSLSDI